MSQNNTVTEENIQKVIRIVGMMQPECQTYALQLLKNIVQLHTAGTENTVYKKTV